MLATVLLVTALAPFAAGAAAGTGAFDGFDTLATSSDEGNAGLGDTPAAATQDASDLGGGSLHGGNFGGVDGALPAPAGKVDSATPPEAAPAPGSADATFDPSVPAAQTPKRPSYRWQSLVPGAIK
ncbi:hypothetical protein [Dokdonella sp.]|uniref:hypothetical protein n=1 Tax=Dokdonella sp. TaxID=2291710 RepID=UPI0031BDFDE2|nr:hypothetical protein [Dokdonella sp.]